MEPNSFQAFGWIAFAIFSGVGGINQVLSLIDRLKEKKPAARQIVEKVIVEQQTRYATHQELMDLKNEFHSFRKEFKRDFDDLIKAGEHRMEKINERLNQLAEDLPMRFMRLIEGRLKP